MLPNLQDFRCHYIFCLQSLHGPLPETFKGHGPNPVIQFAGYLHRHGFNHDALNLIIHLRGCLSCPGSGRGIFVDHTASAVTFLLWTVPLDLAFGYEFSFLSYF